MTGGSSGSTSAGFLAGVAETLGADLANAIRQAVEGAPGVASGTYMMDLGELSSVMEMQSKKFGRYKPLPCDTRT